MNNLILQILPILLLVVLYLFIFTRKGEIQKAKVSYRGHDWLTFIGITLASTVLASAINALGLNIIPKTWLILVLVSFYIFLIVVVVRRARTGKGILKQVGDERTNTIYAKSARNALFATYLTFFVHALITDAHALDTVWLVIILSGGLAVLIASIFFYYYSKS